LTAVERKRLVQERKRNSAFWRVVHWLGSLQLALILFATIAVACAIATVAESEFNAKIAQAYIYKAPWFVLWLGVLCINLFAVTLTRWPWEKKHTGFIITHYGIITLLVGAMIGLHTGFEGNVTLHKDKPPVRKITVNRSIIQVESPNDSALYVMPFDASIVHPSEKRPRTFEVPQTDLKIIADGFSENLVKDERLVPSDSGFPGAVLRFTSARMGQEIEIPLLLENGTAQERDFFGLAAVSIETSLPKSQPAGKAETQMVFGRFAPVTHAEGTASGVKVILSPDGERVTVSGAEGTSATYLRTEAMGKPIPVPGAMVFIEDYWPDFEMVDGKPATKSPAPNNPAALVRVQPLGEASERADDKPSLVIAPSGDAIAYQLRRGPAAYASGTAKPGDKFSTGWADWTVEVGQVFPKAAIVSTMKPGPPLPKGEQGVQGFRARLVSPEKPDAEKRWVASGDITSLTDGLNVVRIGYGLELRPVPFSIRLVDFEVPRYEGTETPSNYIATVEFRDSASGETKPGTAKMNHPASFPGTLLANLTGINYKFSQAEWNPRDLGETTLQVLYDPGWLLKWVGSLAICVGIAIMFYIKPKSTKA
jgi:hypothetical protein